MKEKDKNKNEKFVRNNKSKNIKSKWKKFQEEKSKKVLTFKINHANIYKYRATDKILRRN